VYIRQSMRRTTRQFTPFFRTSKWGSGSFPRVRWSPTPSNGFTSPLRGGRTQIPSCPRASKMGELAAKINRPVVSVLHRYRTGSSSKWLAFGVGDRACLGRPMATLEIQGVVGHLLRNYDISLAPGQPQHEDGIAEKYGGTLNPQPILMNFARRGP